MVRSAQQIRSYFSEGEELPAEEGMDVLRNPPLLHVVLRLVFARDRMQCPYGYEHSGMLDFPRPRIMRQSSQCCILDLLRPCLSLLVPPTPQPRRRRSR